MFMSYNNIFDGESYKAQFAIITYRWLISHRWVTYADIMADYLGYASAKDLPCSISKCDNEGELRKAFPAVCNAIKMKVGNDCFEVEGNKRNKRFRYIGKDNDPLADMKNAKVISSLKQYWQFCQDSAGFFPTSWLEYFFKDSRDLLAIKNKRQKGEQVISASLDRMLTNIDLLPSLYIAITNRQVLSIEYKPYEEETRILVFHPHFLKEYNGRWHLFGHAENMLPEYGYNIALDRIVNKPRELYKYEYVAAPNGFYNKFFNDIVGVSHQADPKVEDVRIRAHSLYIFKLIETKRIHHTQETVAPFGEHENGEYGEFSVQVEINNEFIGRILQMGAGLEIVSPDNVRKMFKQRVEKLAELYK